MTGRPRIDDDQQTGHVYWITGLSCAGKSTLARELVARMKRQDRSVVLLDGDDLRTLYGDGLSYTLHDRRILSERNARLCRLLSNQGIDVFCATICLFQECHTWCREHIAHYHEIYLRVPLDELRRRDTRGLYERALSGAVCDVVGVDLPFDEPAHADLVIDNDGRLTPAEVADLAWHFVTIGKGSLPGAR